MGLPTIVIELGQTFPSTKQFMADQSADCVENSDSLLTEFAFRIIKEKAIVIIKDNILIIGQTSNIITLKFCNTSAYDELNNSVDITVVGDYILHETNNSWFFVSTKFICAEGLKFSIDESFQILGDSVLRYLFQNNFYPYGV